MSMYGILSRKTFDRCYQKYGQILEVNNYKNSSYITDFFHYTTNYLDILNFGKKYYNETYVVFEFTILHEEICKALNCTWTDDNSNIISLDIDNYQIFTYHE